MDENIVIKKLKDKLRQLYENHFYHQIEVSKKLKPLYSKIKKEYKEESYISRIDYYKYRSAITKFRISSHNLPVELGRWDNTNKDKRICSKCIHNSIGDEVHYIFYCTAPELVRIRKLFTLEIKRKYNNITNKEIMQYILQDFECNKSYITGKFLNGIIEFLKKK